MTTEITVTTLATEEEARDITERLKAAIGKGERLWREALRRRVWEPLGHTSWVTYCQKELGVTPRMARYYLAQAEIEAEPGRSGNVSTREATRAIREKRAGAAAEPPIDAVVSDITSDPEARRSGGGTGVPRSSPVRESLPDVQPGGDAGAPHSVDDEVVAPESNGHVGEVEASANATDEEYRAAYDALADRTGTEVADEEAAVFIANARATTPETVQVAKEDAATLNAEVPEPVISDGDLPKYWVGITFAANGHPDTLNLDDSGNLTREQWVAISVCALTRGADPSLFVDPAPIPARSIREEEPGRFADERAGEIITDVALAKMRGLAPMSVEMADEMLPPDEPGETSWLTERSRAVRSLIAAIDALPARERAKAKKRHHYEDVSTWANRLCDADLAGAVERYCGVEEGV